MTVTVTVDVDEPVTVIVGPWEVEVEKNVDDEVW